MTKDELRMKVAELCPDVFFLHNDGQVYQKAPSGFLQYVIDPTSDLNACAEFEKVLKPDQIAGYVHKLENLVCKRAPRYGWSFSLLTATAEQRCRAFVAVMEGKTK